MAKKQDIFSRYGDRVKLKTIYNTKVKKLTVRSRFSGAYEQLVNKMRNRAARKAALKGAR